MKTENYAIQFLRKTILQYQANRKENDVCPAKKRILLDDQLHHLIAGEKVLSELTKELFEEEINRLKKRYELLDLQGHSFILGTIKSDINDLKHALSIR